MSVDNAVMECIETRRCVRSYRADVPPDDLVDAVVEAGTYAATGRGLQSPIIVRITDRRVRDELARINASILGSDTDPFYGAPVVLAVLADRNVSTHVEDGSLVIGNMMLAAHSIGLGSCWIHRCREQFETPEGRAILDGLGIGPEYVGVGNCIVGYVDGGYPEARPRKDGWVYRI